MSMSGSEGRIRERDLARLKRRCRVLLLLDAAEQAGIAPLPSVRLHAFAYLADVLSPVWKLVPFDGKVYKAEGGPRYPDLQDEIDSLVVLGLVQVRDLVYEPRPEGRARISGSYGLNFALASALATLPEDEIELATHVDVTYRTQAQLHNVVDFAEWVDDKRAANPSWRAADRFEAFLPAESKMLAGEKLYLYAAYLGRAMHAR